MSSKEGTLPDRIANTTVKKMDCPCEDGIPGSDLNVESGLSWLNIRLRITERIEFTIDPKTAHMASASCLQRMTAPNRAATSHLLCTNNKCTTNIMRICFIRMPKLKY